LQLAHVFHHSLHLIELLEWGEIPGYAAAK
jgi:hypothetical protein